MSDLKEFTIVANFRFMAVDIDDAFIMLAKHFLDLGVGEESKLMVGGKCEIFVAQEAEGQEASGCEKGSKPHS